MGTFTGFFEALFQYSWMQKALITAMIVGVIGGIIGVFILLKGMVFLGQAIAHTAFAGAALAILIGVEPLFIIIAFGILASIGVGYVNEKKIMKEEIIIGVVFTLFMALAIIFISLNKAYSTDVNTILFGNILLISKLSFYTLIGTSVVVVSVILLLKKEFFMITFNPELAKIYGIPVRLLQYVLLILLALTIDVSLRAIGAILVFAMIVTPAAAAYQWTFKLNKMILISALIGVFSSVGGLFISYLLDLPSSAIIVGLSTLIFIVSFIASPKRRKSGVSVKECQYCIHSVKGVDYCIDKDCPKTDIPHVHDEKGIVIKTKDVKPMLQLTKHAHDKENE